MRFNRMSTREVPSIPVTVDEHNITKGGALEILKVVKPGWKNEENIKSIVSQVFKDGLSNKLVGFYDICDPEDVIIVKVFGSNTGKLIDRQAEVETMRILHERGCGAKLYATFPNGICYEYMNGDILSPEDCKDPQIYPLIVKEMAHMHSSFNDNNNQGASEISHDQKARNGINKTSPIWAKMTQFNKLAEDAMAADAGLRERLKEVGVVPGWGTGAIEELKNILEGKQLPITFCHNDLISRNIVYDPKKKRITFIDVEYAMPNYPAFDVANHFLEFAGVPELDYSKVPNKEFRLKWIREYLKHLELDVNDYPQLGGKKISAEQFNCWVDLCIPVSHLLWGLWSIHQARHSTIDFDYVNYVGKRFAEYKKCMESLKQIEKQQDLV